MGGRGQKGQTSLKVAGRFFGRTGSASDSSLMSGSFWPRFFLTGAVCDLLRGDILVVSGSG